MQGTGGEWLFEFEEYTPGEGVPGSTISASPGHPVFVDSHPTTPGAPERAMPSRRPVVLGRALKSPWTNPFQRKHKKRAAQKAMEQMQTPEDEFLEWYNSEASGEFRLRLNQMPYVVGKNWWTTLIDNGWLEEAVSLIFCIVFFTSLTFNCIFTSY